jgi:predicted dehydrogenase
VANARLVFADGCVATLSASRASHTPARNMHLWTPRCFASVDFATRSATLVQPSEGVLRRQLDLEALSPEASIELKEHLLEEHLPQTQLEGEPCNAIAAELEEFAQCVRFGRQPRVAGQQGHRAVAVAEQILASIGQHAWNGTAEGPVGPLAKSPSQIIPAPHWDLETPVRAPQRRRAG